MTTSESQLPEDRFALLYHLSQTFNTSLDLEEVLNRVMDAVIKATRAERGFVTLRGEAGELDFRAARGLDRQTIEDPQFQISRSVVEEVAQTGEPLLTSNAQRDERFKLRHSVMNLRLRSIICAPLKNKAEVTGVIYVDNHLQAGVFTQKDLELLSTIAASAAIAIENARLYQVAVEKGRLERELQMAFKVQSSLIPMSTPQLPGWEFSAYWQPAREVAGDYYDFIPNQKGEIGLVIADVTDKGMPAALFMALTRSIVRASLDQAVSPAEGITKANRLICADSTTNMPVTLFYGALVPGTGEITYVNAGHNPPIHYSFLGDKFSPLTRSGMFLGFDEAAAYQQVSIILNPGDFIVFYTDGVTDAINAANQHFSQGRLETLVADHRKDSSGNILAALKAAITAHIGETAPYDDITLLIVKRLGE